MQFPFILFKRICSVIAEKQICICLFSNNTFSYRIFQYFLVIIVLV